MIANDFTDAGVELSVAFAVGDRFDLDRQAPAFQDGGAGFEQTEQPSVLRTIGHADPPSPYSFMSVAITSSALTSAFRSSVILCPLPMTTNLSTMG